MKDFKCGIYFDTRRAKSDGTFPIMLKLYREKKNIYLDSGFSSTKEGFDGERFVGTSLVIARLNRELRDTFDKFRLWCLDFKDRGMDNNEVKLYASAYMVDYIRKHDFNDGSAMSVVECWDEFIADCVHSEGNERLHLECQKKLKKYDASVLLRDVDAAWLRGFDNWMMKGGLCTNSRGTIMQKVKAVFSYALNSEYILRHPFRQFKIKQEETRMRALTKEEIIRLRDYPCEDIRQQKARDIWMLMFYLFGINAIDLFNMKGLVGGRCQYRRSKTGKLYDVAVPPEAMEIINRYRGKKYLLNIMEHYKDYKYATDRYDHFLKKIGEHKECRGKKPTGEALFPKLSLYWARYSAASLMAELDIPMETVSRCLGHSSGLRVTQIYVKFSQKKIDEAQRKMIDALK